jgi:hypothetical protein
MSEQPAAHAYTCQALGRTSHQCIELAVRMWLLRAWTRLENAPARLHHTLHGTAADFAQAAPVLRALQQTLLLVSATQPLPKLGGRISGTWHE